MLLLIVSLIICVFLHEASHLIAAKLCKCGIESVSIGFFKPIWEKKIKGITYRITPYLFGGYCKLKGELEPTKSKKAFVNLSYSKKIIILLAGVTTNIITGLISYFIGLKLLNYPLYYFGVLSFWLGICNLIPFIPCLDGGYVFYIPILTKIYGKKKGYKIFLKINKISFYIIMGLNILSIPYLIYLKITGKI